MLISYTPPANVDKIIEYSVRSVEIKSRSSNNNRSSVVIVGRGKTDVDKLDGEERVPPDSGEFNRQQWQLELGFRPDTTPYQKPDSGRVRKEESRDE
ncbi:hypothetical protein ACFX13_044578 [Malus domestica]